MSIENKTSISPTVSVVEDIILREKYIKKFKEQEPLIKEQLMSDEQYVHCLDWDSWNGRYYNPCWVVTSEARVWSLYHRRFTCPYGEECGTRNKNGEYSHYKYYLSNSNQLVCRRANAKQFIRSYIHCLVANYFCDKTPIRLFGEENVCVHHIFGSDRDQSCRWQNRAKHLCYTRKKEHQIMTDLQMGHITPDKFGKYGLEDSPIMRDLVRNAAFSIENTKLRNGIKIVYREDGSHTFSTIVTFTKGKPAWL